MVGERRDRDLGPPDMDGLAVLNEIRKNRQQRLPAIVDTAKEFARVLDGALSLHRQVADLPEKKQKLLAKQCQCEPLLGKRWISVS